MLAVSIIVSEIYVFIRTDRQFYALGSDYINFHMANTNQSTYTSKHF